MPTLADGPAMYFGGTIMTFALPLGAFIVITVALFFLFTAQHSGPKLKYWANARFTLQWVGYTKFDGLRKGASDNNTLYLSSRFAIAPLGAFVRR